MKLKTLFIGLIATCIVASVAPVLAQTSPFLTSAERAEAERKGRAGDLDALWRAAQAWEDVDNKKWEELVRLAEKRDHPQAITEMGNIYYNGWFGHREDERKARRYYERAAKMGNPEAIMQIGALYWRGAGGLRESDDKALEYYQRAMDAGLPGAFLKTGKLYAFQGKEDLAIQYFLEAWERGDTRARDEMSDEGGVYGQIAASLIEPRKCIRDSSEFDAGRYDPRSLLPKLDEREIQNTFYRLGQHNLHSNCFYSNWYDVYSQPGARRIAAQLDDDTARKFDEFARQQAVAGKLAEGNWQKDWDKLSPIDPRREFFSGPGAEEFDQLAIRWLEEGRSSTIDYFKGFPQPGTYMAGSGSTPSWDDADRLGLGFFRIRNTAKGLVDVRYWSGDIIDRLRELSELQGGVLGYLGEVPYTSGETDIPAYHSGPYIKTKLGRDYYFGQMKNGRPHGVGYLIMPELNEIYIGSFVDGFVHGFGGFVHRENGQTDIKAGQFVAGQGLLRGVIRTDFGGDRDVQRVGSFVDGGLSGMGQRQFLGNSSSLYGTIEQGVFGDDRLIAGMIGQGNSLQPYPEIDGQGANGYWLAMSEVASNDVVREVYTPTLMPKPGSSMLQSGGRDLQRFGVRVLDASENARSSEPFRYYVWVYYDDTSEAIQVRQQRAVRAAERRAEAEQKRRYEAWKEKSRQETEAYWKKYCEENDCSSPNRSVASNNSSSYTGFQYNSPSSSSYSDPYGGLNPWDSQYQTQQWMSDPSRYYQNRYDY